jgi:hypothetical protein
MTQYYPTALPCTRRRVTPGAFTLDGEMYGIPEMRMPSCPSTSKHYCTNVFARILARPGSQAPAWQAMSS